MSIERLREIVAKVAEGSTYNAVETSSLAFAVGMTPGDFHRCVEVAQKRKAAVEDIEKARIASQALGIMDEERQKLHSEVTSKIDSLTAEFERLCNTEYARIHEFNARTAAEHSRLMATAAKASSARDLLTRTADKADLSRIAAIKRELDDLSLTIQVAGPIASDFNAGDLEREQAQRELDDAEATQNRLADELEQLESAAQDWRNLSLVASA